MTAIDLVMPTAIRTRSPSLLGELRRRAPFWWGAGLAGLALFALFAGAGLFDLRSFDGAGVWTKPAKFMLSFAVHAFTFAWAFALMPARERTATGNRRLSIAFVAIFALEIAYIAFRASRGEASHFNTASPAAALIYSAMGLGALGLTGITGYFGWRLLRVRTDLAAAAAGWGLILGAVLGTASAMYLGSQAGHSVGGAASDAGGLPLIGWSTTGGDLRVAHFVGLHAMQAVPLAVWLVPHRLALWIAALAATALTAAALLQAMAGVPLLAV